MMLSALTAFLVAGAVAPDPCAAVVDNNGACAAPASVASPIAPDVKSDPKHAVHDDVIAPQKLSGEIGFASALLAVGGGAVLVASFANAPRTDQERTVRTVEQWGGAGLLVWSGLVGVSAAALAVFDPSTGEFKAKPWFGAAD